MINSKNYSKFFRLVSAYEDKFAHFNKYYNSAYGKIMKKRYGDTSFKSFVKMILSTKGCRYMSRARCHLDVHWQPYYSNCCYCRVHYKYFIRAENLETDVKFIGKLANVSFHKIGMKGKVTTVLQ